MSMQSLKKIGKKGTKVRARKQSAKHFWHTSRAITLFFQNEISPLAIPYHSSPIPMSMQSLKKIGQKILKLAQKQSVDGQMDGWWTDGRTDGHSKFGGYNMIIYIYISMHMQNFTEIRLFILKILSKKAFWTWIKGHNYVVSKWNYPTRNSIPLLSDTNVFAMHLQNFIEIPLFIHIDQKCILNINQGP